MVNDMLRTTGRYALLGGLVLFFAVLAAGCTSLDGQFRSVQTADQALTTTTTAILTAAPVDGQSLDGLGQLVSNLARDWKIESYAGSDTSATATLVNSAGDRATLKATLFGDATAAHAAYLEIQKQASQYHLAALSLADEGYGFTGKEIAEAGGRSRDLLVQVTYHAADGQASLDQAADMARQVIAALG